MAPSVQDLTPAQCILLTVYYASQANIRTLHSFTPSRLDALDPELVLRILLTFLPESVDPAEYSTYVEEVASRLYLDVTREHIGVDTSPVQNVDAAQAEKRVKKLDLLEIMPPAFPPHAPKDILTRFLVHRSFRIDSETGMLHFVQKLVRPFLDRNDWLKTWYISLIVPLVRLNLDYYTQEEGYLPMAKFQSMDGEQGIDLLLAKAQSHPDNKSDAARDVRGLVGPWMYGHTERKRRRVDGQGDGDDGVKDLTNGIKKIGLGGVSEGDKTGHDWEYVYKWMVERARTDFPLIMAIIEEWDGPGDVDLDGVIKGHNYLEDEMQRKLELQYAQAAFASCYAVQADTEQTVRGAHSVLARLAELLDFIPPPDLASSVESLPNIERQAAQLDESQRVEDLEPAALLNAEHPLTTPRMETYMLLQMMVYSAYQFLSLGHHSSLVNVAKLHFYSTAEEQLAVLRKILHSLAKGGKRDEGQWTLDRAKLIWLWNWGIDPEDTTAKNGAGVLGKVEKEDFEKEMLKIFTETSCFNLAIEMVSTSENRTLPREQAEDVVLGKAMEAYDAATNGNRTRGSMEKASDIIQTFRSSFPSSVKFRQATSLISATHALSFYSLTLQHGVPFQPVSIRVSKDPIGLISNVLEQNPRGYTKLDDLIDIAQNIVSAGLPVDDDDAVMPTEDKVNNDLPRKLKEAERRVTSMAVEAALREDDFETAYSYVVNRLTPSSTDIISKEQTSPGAARTTKHVRDPSKSSITLKTIPIEDDISWRAAFLAGRYRPTTASPPTLRRLEQRTELLSLALLLAPTSALNDILTAWRRCEEETSALQLAQTQEEEEFDDRADRRDTSALPGNFTLSTDQPAMILGQKRREMGRMAGTKGDEDAPVSMFDLTRSAARAFSRNAFPLGSGGGAQQQTQTQAPSQQATTATRTSGESSRGLEGSTGSLGEDGGQRVRRRDMVANAVSGGLASGLGWVLGAAPVNPQQGQQGQQQQQR